MIIAEIGSTKFLIDDVTRAEFLIRILGEAKIVDQRLIFETREQIIYESPVDPNIQISIIPDQDILTADEGLELIKKDRALESAKNFLENS